MDQRIPEFFVDHWVTGASGDFTLIGRCGDVALRLNDRFDAVLRYKKRKYPDEMGEEPIIEHEAGASIRIDRIQAYGRSLEMLGEGMTGSIVVSGEGIERIASGTVLGMRNGHHHQNGQGS